MSIISLFKKIIREEDTLIMTNNRKYLAMDIGCLECGEKSNVIGIFDTRELAEEYIYNVYITNEPNSYGSSWGRKEWSGSHSCEVFEIKITNNKLR